MPCVTETDAERSRALASEMQLLTGSLCAVLSWLERRSLLQTTLDEIDWAEAGVERVHLRKWWSQHRRRDQQRRREEMEERSRQRTRRRALEKLSPEEREALGIREED